MIEIRPARRATYLRNCRIMATISAIAAAVYLQWLLFSAKPDNPWLYWLLVGAELFNIVQAAGFWVTISTQRWGEPDVPDFSATTESVDIFVTVLGEPLDVVERTVEAAAAIRHPRARVWILDDGASPQVQALTQRYPVGYIARTEHDGAKAGNINHALAHAYADYFVVFDADQVAHADFLERTLGALIADPDLAFVQTPQVYRNRFTNRVAAGAHNQQALFYGPILRGKNGANAVFSCGTNVVYRRSAIDAIGGVPEDSITEDLRASLLFQRQGLSAAYVPLVLAEGLGPMDVNSYFNQQFRWARGGLEILFKKRPFARGMRPMQLLQYFLGFLYWFTGWAYMAYLVLPVTFLLFRLRPVQVPNTYPQHFLPYVLLSLATIVYAADFDIRFDALWFTLASFPVYAKALVSTFVGHSAKFVVTPKAGGRVSLKPVRVHIGVSMALVMAALWGLWAIGPTPSVINNVAWVIAHLVILSGFVWLAINPERSAIAAAEEYLLDPAELEARNRIEAPVAVDEEAAR